MSIKEDVIDMKKEINDIKKESFAYELLQDQKKQNKRLFIIWIITFVSFLALLGYTIYLLNDTGVIEETQITQDNKDGYNNYIGNNGDINNGKTDN